MAVFSAVAQRLSFTEAAAELQISKSSVSQKVAELEAALGVRLLHRNSRKVSLTHPGQIFAEKCREMVTVSAAAHAEMAAFRSSPSGVLRLTCPEEFSNLVISKTVAAFRRRYPKVRVQINVTNRWEDMIESGYDLAIRGGPLAASGLIAKKFRSTPTYLVASPEYLSEHGEPFELEALKRHQTIATEITPVWRFKKDGDALEFRPEPAIRVSNTVMARDLALGGAGIAQVPEIYVANDLAAGHLRVVLTGYRGPVRDLFLVYPSRNQKNISVMRFMEVCDEIIKAVP